MRIVAPLLPLAGLWKWKNTRIRFGMGTLALVAIIELNLGVLGPELWMRSVALLGSVVMVFLGWTGTPPPQRLSETKELLPWVVGFVLLLAVLKVASRLLGTAS
jgi:hypothetical protein